MLYLCMVIQEWNHPQIITNKWTNVHHNAYIYLIEFTRNNGASICLENFGNQTTLLKKMVNNSDIFAF